MIVGINAHPFWADSHASDSARIRDADAIAAMGVKTARVDVGWGMFEPAGPGKLDPNGVAKFEKRIGELTSRGISVLVCLKWAPVWSTGTSKQSGVPKDGADYGRILGFLAAKYPQVIGWEMWNEPDQASEFAGTPEQYAALIKAAYPIAKALAPKATFILGAPTYLGLAAPTSWFAKLFAAGIKGSYDAIGIHPYIAPADHSPSTETGQWSIKGISLLLALLAQYGEEGRDLWATEFGASTHTNTATESNASRGVSEATQAAFVPQFFAELAKFPTIKAAFWYDIRDNDVVSINAGNYGLIRRDFTTKPAAQAMKAMLDPLAALTAERDALLGKLAAAQSENARLEADNATAALTIAACQASQASLRARIMAALG